MSKKYSKAPPVGPREPGMFGDNFRPITETQKQLQQSINDNIITIVYGSAGTGKTHVPTNMACEALYNREISRIVLTRPAVCASENFGFLPGTLDEKYAPYLLPFEDIFVDRFGRSHYENMLKNKRIDPRPLAFMRSATFTDCWILADEFQNTCISQVELLLTRIGENCKVIMCGDLKQTDIRGGSGLEDALYRLHGMDGVGVVKCGQSDVVRSGIVKEIVERYDRS
jgi:phosphate starvation-inducible PhoH-like protein